MDFFKKKTSINFLGIRRFTAVISLVLVLGSIASIAINGLNFGMDFTGGYRLVVSYPGAVSTDKIKQKVDQTSLKDVEVIAYGTSNNVLLQIPLKQHLLASEKTDSDRLDVLKAKVPLILGGGATVISSNLIGPEVGQELVEKGSLAFLVAMLATMLYIGLRFEMRFALSAGVALLHDPILIVGVFSLFHLNFDLFTLAAVLGVIGYSLNDTVVVYDRIRENFRKYRKDDVVSVVNRAINDTLSRTIITSGLTLLTVVVLYIWGGPTIENFALAFILGIAVGTYSSIYVAGALAVMFGLNRNALVPSEKVVDDRP